MKNQTSHHCMIEFDLSFLWLHRNFVRVSSGPELGAYYHEFFLRDKPHLAAQMFCKNARAKLAMANDPNPNVTVPAIGIRPQETLPVASPPQSVALAPSQQEISVAKPQIDATILALLQQQRSKTSLDEKIKSALYPPYAPNNVQLLERQMQILQQDLAQRFLVEQLIRSASQQQQVTQPIPMLQNQQSSNRLLQMRQLMELRLNQRQGRVPQGSRASAA
jgi:hypothetical protein